ncbi:hypothetical protein FOZ76_27270 [Verticiella sediminum]|uniref:Sarcosine oxidase subunit gamma n=1 Tax=Verticiella sediminum TaxID=1247510 RepID=A0A556A5Y8_9BURK|nr:hypothetical protein [Verticiella sediminum]TSH88287.1 hypothetical protein FOZ76_27270 [Verticiella sediminum]
MVNDCIAVPRVEWRTLADISVVSVRRMAGDRDVPAVFERLGLRWPQDAGEVQAGDPAVLWRSPSEALVVSTQAAVAASLLERLQAGKSPSSVALEVSEQTAVLEIEGHRLTHWLAQLVDTHSLPRPGRIAGARLADIGVLIFNAACDRVWILVDRTLLAYLESWLVHARNTAHGQEAVQ